MEAERLGAREHEGLLRAVGLAAGAEDVVHPASQGAAIVRLPVAPATLWRSEATRSVRTGVQGKPAENPIELEDEEKWRMLPRLFS